jgi:peptidoglycan/xylan/chitin deacetylase (PgdA/CDA1 family)
MVQVGASRRVCVRRPDQRARRTAAGAAAALLLLTGCSGAAPPSSHAIPQLASPPGRPSTPAPALVGFGTPQHLPTVLFHGSRSQPAVALTFDSNLTTYMERELDTGRVRSFDDTAAIDELIRMKVPATFFLSGLWMQRYPDETRRLAGVPFFELGSHSYAHLGFTPHCYDLGTLPLRAMAPDIERSERVLRQLDPEASRLFRFPGGCYDRQALAAARAANVQVVQYDDVGGDAFGHSVSRIVNQTLQRARNGSIVVLHITGGNTAPLTAQALPSIIRGLRSRGFAFVTVSQLAASGTDGT